MIGLKHALGVTLIASATFGGAAVAAAPAPKTPVPATIDGTQGPETTDAKNLDQNAQRSHSRDGTASGDTGVGNSAAALSAATAQAPSTRYWEEYDVNKDNLMEPTEIEAMLKDSQSKTKSAG